MELIDHTLKATAAFFNGLSNLSCTDIYIRRSITCDVAKMLTKRTNLYFFNLYPYAAFTVIFSCYAISKTGLRGTGLQAAFFRRITRWLGVFDTVHNCTNHALLSSYLAPLHHNIVFFNKQDIMFQFVTALKSN